MQRFAALCRALDEAGYSEEGDAWVREEPHRTLEVRLRDGAVEIRVGPAP